MQLQSGVIYVLLLIVPSIYAFFNLAQQNGAYGTKRWDPTPAEGNAKWQKPLRPLVLIPGMGGSVLYSRSADSTGEPERVWYPTRNQDELVMEKVNGYFNGTSVVQRDGRKIEIKDDDDGLSSIDNLEPTPKDGSSSPFYFHSLINDLINLGYEPGKTLFGFPYDWRQSVRHSETMNRLERLIHRLGHATNDKNPVDFITFEMGGLVLKSFVIGDKKDAISKIGNWVAIATPWHGEGAMAYKALLSGNPSDVSPKRFVNWGLSAPVAHANEINWPSTFELLPDTDHNAWETTNFQIQFNVVGAAPTIVNTTAGLSELAKAVNYGNMQVFPSGTHAISNPLNLGAWEWAKETRKLMVKFNTLDWTRNAATHASGLKITAISGSQIPTQNSLSFATPIKFLAELQLQPSNDAFVPGDGIVPYLSARSDGLGAKHLEYRGSASHAQLLSEPEVFYGVRDALGLGCLIAGVWNVSIRDPKGNIFSNQSWGFNDESAIVRLNGTLDRPFDVFATTLDETSIYGWLRSDCMAFEGLWTEHGYGATGVRVIGTECDSGSYVEEHHATMTKDCVYGKYSHQLRFVKCDDGFNRSDEECQAAVSKTTPPWVWVLVAAFVICSVAAFVVWLRDKVREYKSRPDVNSVRHDENAD